MAKRQIYWVESGLDEFQAWLPHSHFDLIVSDLPLQLQSDQILLTSKSVKMHLGKSYGRLVLVADRHFPVTALASLLGALHEGGILLVVVLPQASAMTYTGKLKQALLTQQAICIRCLTEVQLQPEPPRMAKDFPADVQQIQTWMESHQAWCWVRGARGRGKSTRVGDYLGQSSHDFCVTATSPEQTHQLQKRLALVGKSLPFKPLDVLLQNAEPLDLLVIEEAASFGVANILAVARLAKRLLLISTLEGYEGSAQGMEQRLIPALTQLMGEGCQILLHAAFRWHGEDDLEEKVLPLLGIFPCPAKSDPSTFELPAHSSISSPGLQQIQWQVHRPEDIAFGPQWSAMQKLLIQAHYRTQPQDWQRLVDDPRAQLFLGFVPGEERPLAVAWVTQEGGWQDVNLSQNIWQGQRRILGERIVQTLIMDFGITAYSGQIIGRIVRIAVAAEYRRQGIGFSLIQQIKAHARHQAWWGLGASLGLTPALVRFWRKADFTLIKLGQKPQASSGEASGVFVAPIAQDAQQQINHWQLQFNQAWLNHRRCPQSTWNPSTWYEILQSLLPLDLTEGERHEIWAWSQSHRPLESSGHLLLLAVTEAVQRSWISGKEDWWPAVVWGILLPCDKAHWPEEVAKFGQRPLMEALRKLFTQKVKR